MGAVKMHVLSKGTEQRFAHRAVDGGQSAASIVLQPMSTLIALLPTLQETSAQSQSPNTNSMG
jgi:uncharacterized protein